MPQNNQYLIISQSARALATLAKRAGVDTHGIDLFADEDTMENTLSTRSVVGFNGGNNARILIKIIAEYASNNANLHLVIGSGLEACPRLLTQLAHRFSVIGNHAHIVRQLKDPAIFFHRLEKLALPYPEYRINITQAPRGKFLIKTRAAAGGAHIRHYKNTASLSPENYLQALLKGKSYSATFITNGESLRIFGFNETWVCQEDTDFSFAGVASNAKLPSKLCQQITDAIQKLITSFKIKGLCSLDFIVDESGQYAILEVNPRPTASFELYATQENLFLHHIAAFEGKLTQTKPDQNQSRGLKLLYAKKNITVPCLDWPKWVTDKPKAGKHIAKGAPICTVHAEGLNVKNVKQQLNTRRNILRELLTSTMADT